MRAIGTREPTRYEIELRHSDGRAFLVAYAARNTGSGLRATVNEHDRFDAIERITGASTFTRRGKTADGYSSDNGWAIRFSGHTQRDRRTIGELPFILDA